MRQAGTAWVGNGRSSTETVLWFCTRDGALRETRDFVDSLTQQALLPARQNPSVSTSLTQY
eukprot:3898928-Rhodomonas_salina.1